MDFLNIFIILCLYSIALVYTNFSTELDLFHMK
jgi:hypothetical protein